MCSHIIFIQRIITSDVSIVTCLLTYPLSYKFRDLSYAHIAFRIPSRSMFAILYVWIAKLINLMMIIISWEAKKHVTWNNEPSPKLGM